MNYWYWAQSKCASLDYELVSWKLFEAGVGSIEEIDRDDQYTFFKFYTESDTQRDFLCSSMPELNWDMGQDEAKDWDTYWKEQQVPVQVSEDFWIRPPWVKFDGKEEDVVLQLEAKMAFGTGEHESTRMIAQLMKKVNLQDKKLLDIGTGTGILAMYALKKGAQDAIFTEIDPVTLPCIEENFKLNNLEQPAGILGGLDAFSVTDYFDVILCNMIKTEFWPLRNDILRLLSESGYFLLSGQLLVDKEFLIEWAQSENFEVAFEAQEKEWWTVAFKRKIR